MFSVTVTDICIGCHGHHLQLPTSLWPFSDVRGSVAYIFYTLWQCLEFIEEQLGPVRNVVTLDCLPRPGYRLQTSHNTKLPDDETNKMYIPHWLQAAELHIHLSSLMAANMSISSSG